MVKILGLVGVCLLSLWGSFSWGEKNRPCSLALDHITKNELKDETLGPPFSGAPFTTLNQLHPYLKELLLKLQQINRSLEPLSLQQNSRDVSSTLKQLHSIYYELFKMNSILSENQLSQDLKLPFQKSFETLRTQIFNLKSLIEVIKTRNRVPSGFQEQINSIRINIMGEIGEFTALLAVPFQSLKRSSTVKNLVPHELKYKFASSHEDTLLLSREIDLVYNENSKDVWTEVKNNEGLITRSKMLHWLQRPSGHPFLSQLGSHLRIKELLNKDFKLQVIFIGGITQEAISELHAYFGTDFSVFSGVTIEN